MLRPGPAVFVEHSKDQVTGSVRSLILQYKYLNIKDTTDTTRSRRWAVLKKHTYMIQDRNLLPPSERMETLREPPLWLLRGRAYFGETISPAAAPLSSGSEQTNSSVRRDSPANSRPLAWSSSCGCDVP